MKEETPLAKMVYEQSIKNSWPGLGNDVKHICLKIGIPDLNYHDNTKVNIKEAIMSNYYSWLQTNVDNSGKLFEITLNNEFSQF